MRYHISKINKSNYFTGFQKCYDFRELTNTNSIIRKELWEDYHFDESLQESEDHDWAAEMLARGYKIVYDPAFNVYHSHGGFGRPTLYDRLELWKGLVEKINLKPRPSRSTSKVQ